MKSADSFYSVCVLYDARTASNINPSFMGRKRKLDGNDAKMYVRYMRQHPHSLVKVFAVRPKKPYILAYQKSAQRTLIRLCSEFH